MITELKRSRNIKPFENNWLLFASTVEAALLEFTGECDMERMLYGVKNSVTNGIKGMLCMVMELIFTWTIIIVS